jgi:hypothetical protein
MTLQTVPKGLIAWPEGLIKAVHHSLTHSELMILALAAALYQHA